MADRLFTLASDREILARNRNQLYDYIKKWVVMWEQRAGGFNCQSSTATCCDARLLDIRQTVEHLWDKLLVNSVLWIILWFRTVHLIWSIKVKITLSGIFYKPVSQSCAVANIEKFWRATGQPNLADRWLAATKASNFWFSYSHNCTLACGAVFHSVCQAWLSGGPPEVSTFSYCTWFWNWLIESEESKLFAISTEELKSWCLLYF